MKNLLFGLLVIGAFASVIYVLALFSRTKLGLAVITTLTVAATLVLLAYAIGATVLGG